MKVGVALEILGWFALVLVVVDRHVPRWERDELQDAIRQIALAVLIPAGAVLIAVAP